MSTEILSNLNSPQKTAVQTVNGPVLVLAGPGSGKTRVLTRRIAYLIEEAGIAPWNILAVTFTNKAAREMQERVEELLQDRFGDPLPGQPRRLGGLTIGTFHSICARVLRIETGAIGYERNWVIYDSADQLALIRGLMREMNLDEKRYSPNAVRAIISRWKNELHTPETAQPASYPEEIASRVYGRYQEAMQVNNAMDFDDLLMKTTMLLRDSEELRIKYQQKWQYILVDEFQDTNTAQYELIRLLATNMIELSHHIVPSCPLDPMLHPLPVYAVIVAREKTDGAFHHIHRHLHMSHLHQHHRNGSSRYCSRTHRPMKSHAGRQRHVCCVDRPYRSTDQQGSHPRSGSTLAFHCAPKDCAERHGPGRVASLHA